MKEKNKFRKFINDIHLWLGLIAGIVLFIVCLSGSIYVFRSDIEYFVNPNKYNASDFNNNSPYLPIEKLVATLEKTENGKVSFIEIPENREKNILFGLSKKTTPVNNKIKSKGDENIQPKRQRPTTYYVNPYSGKIAGKDGDKASEFFMIVMKLHRFLLLDPSIGRPIIGISTLIFILLSISGLILWFPKKFKYWKRWNHWKPGFKIKFKARWKRINHDLHNTLGFYSLFLLLLMAITGLCWSFEWYKNGLGKIMGSEVFAGRNEKPLTLKNTSDQTISFEEVERIVNQQLPYKGDVRINIPKDSAHAYSISKSKSGIFAIAAPDKMNLNPYNGEIISLDLFKDKPLNVQIVSLIKPLHIGDIMGTFSKVLYFICCLIGTSLPVTGIIIWFNKMKKKK
ncbi:PepSY domain-containing protein [Apibacter muscae]|uniref:PepSY domain-containing protein n=1 Tax=Apibacter muscae TaxID=2509004 RepID=A0A563DI01_9FLAO|nr:PepSY-associated TM helix domain-containing protein [Apibacter muscae]TWP29473.1 PepSY domain-containing protein [Apibacter muscae]TWP30121.1 PepSY domain-containing protein [Apibacter muscae]